LVREVFSNLEKYSITDLAFSVEAYLAKSLGTNAVNLARELDFKHIGLSGGVAYNEHIAEEVKRIIQAEDLVFLANERVPCGDGGVSFGQAVAAGLLM
jgi:hydrogenase maturation protein HypF